MQTGVYSAEFGRGASQVNVVTKSGSNASTARCSSSTATTRSTRGRTRSPRRRRRPRKAPFKWDQYGYTAGGPVWKNQLFFMSNFEGYQDRKQFQTAVQRAVGGDAGRRLRTVGSLERQPADRTADRRDRRPDAVHGRRHDADLPPFAGNIIPASRFESDLAAAARVLSRAEQRRPPASTNNYLSFQDRVIDKNQYTQRDGLRAELRVDLDGPLQLRARRTR